MPDGPPYNLAAAVYPGSPMDGKSLSHLEFLSIDRLRQLVKPHTSVFLIPGEACLTTKSAFSPYSTGASSYQ